MYLPARLTVLFASTALLSFATPTYNFPGPTTTTGVPCLASDPAYSTCVASVTSGSVSSYAIYGAQLTQNTPTTWTLSIETNYPVAIIGNVIPTAQWGVDLQFYSISDFLINWNGHDYGIVLSQHIQAGNSVDSYVGGNLYQAPNTQYDLVLSGTNNTPQGLAPGVLPQSPRANEPVWLAPGGNLLGTGTVTVAATGSGTPAAYTITDQFNAPANFLSTGSFTVDASSWVCANGIIIGTGTVGGTGGQVPEPGTFLLLLPALLLLFVCRRALRSA